MIRFANHPAQSKDPYPSTPLDPQGILIKTAQSPREHPRPVFPKNRRDNGGWARPRTRPAHDDVGTGVPARPGPSLARPPSGGHGFSSKACPEERKRVEGCRKRPKNCHLERSGMIRFANHPAQSKDPYPSTPLAPQGILIKTAQSLREHPLLMFLGTGETREGRPPACLPCTRRCRDRRPRPPGPEPSAAAARLQLESLP